MPAFPPGDIKKAESGRMSFGIDAMEPKNPNPPVLVRFGIGLAFWLVMDGGKPAGLIIGLPSAALAAWVSVKLLPPGGLRPRWGAMAVLVWCSLRDAVVAGVDVAVRVFHPRLPLRTGFVKVTCGIPAGPRRDLLLAIGGLMPGSLPVEESPGGEILLHCLDTSQPVAAQMAEQEARLQRALGGTPDA